MKKSTLFFVLGLTLFPYIGRAATCSRANLTRCLDSACAINVSSNPAARCQYCGTASAGTPPTKGGMKALSVGTSSKNTLTEKELKKAPSDPGDRYAWATAQCIAKVGGCTADDVSDVYDKLIEQSCKAAGINAQMATLHAAAKKTKTESACKTDITACLIDVKRCGADYRSCEANADFDKFFSACSVEATGCDDYIAGIRTKLIAARDESIKNADTLLANITKSYQDAREKKLASIRNGCKDNNARDACVESVCERSMANKCGVGFESEKSMAIQLCKFYELACAAVKL